MTPAERFQDALANTGTNRVPHHTTITDYLPDWWIERIRSAHAACVEEARVEGEAAGRVDSASRIVQAAEDAYERGLREGAERERKECIELLLYCGFEGSAAAIRARSKGGDAS